MIMVKMSKFVCIS